MARYYVEMDSLKEKGEELQQFANNTIDGTIKEFLDLTKNFVWDGPLHDVFMDIFQEKVKKIRYVAAMVETFGKIMVISSEGYDNVNNNILKDWQKYLDEKYNLKPKESLEDVS